jgi:DNA-binding transcriptional LysR family regulator
MLNGVEDLSGADLNLLVLFETVMGERHVRRAAERLHLSPSAVSHGLSRLRRLLGDPLFLRTPRGVVPTARAAELSGSIADILVRVRGVVGSAKPFDPARSTRRFTIGAPDGAVSVFLPPLLDALQRNSPHLALSIRELLPRQAAPSPDLAWRDALAELEARALDVAVIPLGEVPARFVKRPLYDEDFVIAMRAGHPFAKDRSLRGYCAQRHLVVSQSGDPSGFVDAALARRKRARHVALTAPNFHFALAMLSDSDLLAAMPRQFVARYGTRHGVVAVDAPLPLRRFRLHIVAPKVALMDAGLSWLIKLIEQTAQMPAAGWGR